MLLTNFHAVRITLFDVNAVGAFTREAIGRAIPVRAKGAGCA